MTAFAPFYVLLRAPELGVAIFGARALPEVAGQLEILDFDLDVADITRLNAKKCEAGDMLSALSDPRDRIRSLSTLKNLGYCLRRSPAQNIHHRIGGLRLNVEIPASSTSRRETMTAPLPPAEAEDSAVGSGSIGVHGIDLEGFPIAISGRLIRIATIRDEPWRAGCVTDPAPIIAALRAAKPRPDMFAFSQRLPDTARRFEFHCEYDNVAALPISTYDSWLTSQVKPNARNKVRKAQKSGVTTRVVRFDDALVHGISAIYNETPVRQGKKFWHYGKDFETVKKENGTYTDRCDFIGAYLNDELIGFLKMVHVGSYAEVMQILSMTTHRDRAPTNALIAKAVEVCGNRKLSHLVYANFAYGNRGDDSLTEFKRSNGFIRVDIPRYFVPLTTKGRIALALGLHRGPTTLLPKWLLVALVRVRKRWNDLRYGMNH